MILSSIRIIVFSFFLIFVSRVNGQDLPVYGPAKASPLGRFPYKQYQHDKRYEGTFQRNKNRFGYSVFSLLQGDLTYDCRVGEVLKISASSALPLKGLNVVGTSIKSYPDYRLDFFLPVGKTFKVPVADVIKGSSLYAKNLGIYGYVGEYDYPDLYVPVDVRSSLKDTLGKQVKLTIVSIHATFGVYWRYGKIINGTCTDFSKGVTLRKIVPKDGLIEIPLIFDKDVRPGDVVCIQVQALINSGSELDPAVDIRVLIPRI